MSNALLDLYQHEQSDPPPAPINFWTLTREQLSIRLPALPRPTFSQLRKFGCAWASSIRQDVSVTTAVELKLGTLLREGEECLQSCDYDARITDPNLPVIPLGFQHAAWLVQEQFKFPELQRLVSKTYIDFPGIRVVGIDDEDVRFPSLPLVRGPVRLGWDWFRSGLSKDGHIAAADK